MEENNKVTIKETILSFFAKNYLWISGLVIVLIGTIIFSLILKPSNSPLMAFGEALAKNLEKTNSTLVLKSGAVNLDATIKYDIGNTIDTTTIDIIASEDIRGMILDGEYAYSIAGVLSRQAGTIKDALGENYDEFSKTFDEAIKNKEKKDSKELAISLQEAAKEQELKYADKINEEALTQAGILMLKFDKSIAKDTKIFANYSKKNNSDGITYSFDFNSKALAESFIDYLSANYGKHKELKTLLDAMATEKGEHANFVEAIATTKAEITNTDIPSIPIKFTVLNNGFLGKAKFKYQETDLSIEFTEVGTTEFDKADMEKFIQSSKELSQFNLF